MEMPQEPPKPLDSDCCGQGCIPCVFDIYDEEMKIWQRECDRIKNGENRLHEADNCQGKYPLLNGTEYCTFKIISITKETHDTYRYRFVLPFGCNLGLKVGQHIVIRGHINRETVTRQYTPISDISATSHFELMIKVYDNGKMSQFIKDWNIGNKIEIRGPCGHIEYKPNKYRRLVMLCVGTGIAPMSQLIQHVLNNESDETCIELLYGCRTGQDILMKSELDEWSRFWNFSVTYYLSQDTGASKNKYGDKVVHSRIDFDSIKISLTNMADVFVLICGTRSFEKDMIDICRNLGISSNKYHKF